MRRFALLLIIGFLLSQSPLVELSKKEKKRRKKSVKTKVITNVDLGRSTSSLNILGKAYSPSTETAGTKEFPEKTLKPGQKKDKKWWSGRRKAIYEKINKLRKKIQELNTKVNGLSNQFLLEQRPFAQARVKEELEKAKGALQQAKADLANAEKELENLYNEARKEGIPPGWIR